MMVLNRQFNYWKFVISSILYIFKFTSISNLYRELNSKNLISQYFILYSCVSKIKPQQDNQQLSTNTRV